jgi:maleylpyruvate isomerase
MIAGCVTSHTRLVVHLEKVDDVVLRRPSRLEGWSVGHVLTHLARNADSFVRMLEAAEMGESVPQYMGARDQRDGDIESGASRSAAACINDVRRSNERLEKAFATASPAAWDGSGVWMNGQPAPCRLLPFRRWREVEFHLVDLGLGYEPTDWPEDFVSLALTDALADLPPRIADGAQRASLLAWLAGRRDTPGTVEFAPF